MLDDRKSRVLQALVEEYIRTGEPVSSQTILERSGLDVSSATIRNDLAKLESYGFVQQPHTSSGRIPTDQGYRYYVDHCSPARLQSATRSRIEAFFTGMHRELSRLLKDTSHLLSDLTHYPAVVIGPGFGTDEVHAVHLVPLSSTVVLAVTVAESGRVSQDIVRLSFAPTERELDEAETLLQQAFAGQVIPRGRKRAREAEADAPEQVRSIVRAVSRVIARVEGGTRDVYLGGTSQLAALWQDLATVQRILGLLEEETSLATLLDDGEGTHVKIGAEIDVPDVDLAVVSTTYEAGEQGVGRVGVLGPMRMNYRRTIKVVEEVGEGLADSLGS